MPLKRIKDLTNTLTAAGVTDRTNVRFALDNTQGAVDRTDQMPLSEFSKTLGRIDVRDFGAKGDGSTDDHAAIQAAINAAAAAHSVYRPCVFIPAGGWRLTDMLDVPDYIELRGAGKAATTLIFAPSVGNKACIQFANSTPYHWFGGVRDVTVKILDAALDNLSGVYIESGTRVRINNVLVDAYGLTTNRDWYGFRIAGREQIQISDCTTMTPIGIYIEREPVSGVGLDNCSFNNMTYLSAPSAQTLTKPFAAIHIEDLCPVSNLQFGGHQTIVRKKHLIFWNSTAVTSSDNVSIENARTETPTDAAAYNCVLTGTSYRYHIGLTNCRLQQTVNGIDASGPIQVCVNRTRFNNTSKVAIRTAGSATVYVDEQCSFASGMTVELASGGQTYQSLNVAEKKASRDWRIKFPADASSYLIRPDIDHYETANTAPRTITSLSRSWFDQGTGRRDNQIITLKLDANTTLQHGTGTDATSLRDGVNWTPAAEATITFRYDGSYWKEVCRSTSDATAGAGSYVSILDFGAVGNGIANDTTAYIAARDSGQTVFFPPGTYLLSTLTNATAAGSVSFIGDGAIIQGPGLTIDAMQIDPGDSVRLRGLTFNNFRHAVFLRDALGGNVHEAVDIEDCNFTNGVQAITDSGQVDEVKRFLVRRCVIDTMTDRGICTRGRRQLFCVIRDNEIKNIVTSTAATAQHGILVGESSEQNSEHVVVHANKIDTITNNGAGGTNYGILVYGRGSRITHNEVRDVVNDDGIDCYGIYAKSARAIIDGNTLVNAGRDDGMICVKGESSYESLGGIKGYGGTISRNSLLCTVNDFTVRGINVFCSDWKVVDNTIEGQGTNSLYRGIAVSRDNVKVARNTIFGQTHNNTVAGIYLTAVDNVDVIDNDIYNMSTTTNYAVGVWLGGVSSNVRILRNTTRNFSGGSQRCGVYFYSNAGALTDIDISRNVFDVTKGLLSFDTGTVTRLTTIDNRYLSNVTVRQQLGTQTIVSHRLDESSARLNILDFGAIGDGTTNNATAVQAAFNAVSAGGEVVVPDGTFRVNTPLTVSQAMRLVGTGTIDFNLTGTGIASTADLVVDGPSFTSTGVGCTIGIGSTTSALTIRNSKFYSFDSDTSLFVVQTNASTKLLIEDCDFSDLKCLSNGTEGDANGALRAIYIAGAMPNGRIRKCTFTDIDNRNAGGTKTYEDADAIHCYVPTTGDQFVEISSCTFSDVGKRAVKLQGTASSRYTFLDSNVSSGYTGTTDTAAATVNGMLTVVDVLGGHLLCRNVKLTGGVVRYFAVLGSTLCGDVWIDKCLHDPEPHEYVQLFRTAAVYSQLTVQANNKLWITDSRFEGTFEGFTMSGHNRLRLVGNTIRSMNNGIALTSNAVAGTSHAIIDDNDIGDDPYVGGPTGAITTAYCVYLADGFDFASVSNNHFQDKRDGLYLPTQSGSFKLNAFRNTYSGLTRNIYNPGNYRPPSFVVVQDGVEAPPIIWHDDFQRGILPRSQRVETAMKTRGNSSSWFVVSTAEDEKSAAIDLDAGALHIVLPNGTTRTEVRPDGINHPDFAADGVSPSKYGVYWYTLETKLDASYPTGASETGTILFQHLTNAAVNPTLALYLYNGEYRLAVRGDNNTGSWVRDAVPWTASYTADVGNWVRWAWRFKQGQAGGDSFLELYKNGTLVYSESGQHLGWLNGESVGPIWKFGTYAYGAGAFDHVISYRNASILHGDLVSQNAMLPVAKDSAPVAAASHRWSRTLTTYTAAATKLCDLDLSKLDPHYNIAKVTVHVSVGHSAAGNYAIAKATRTAVVAWMEKNGAAAPVIIDAGTASYFADPASAGPNFVVAITDLSFAVSGNYIRVNCTADTSNSQASYQYATSTGQITLVVEGCPAGAVNILIP